MNSLRRAVPVLLVLILALVAPGNLLAQQDVTLQRVQSLMNSGRFTEARNTLENWERTHAAPDAMVNGDDRARALYLRGALATDPAEAEQAYVGVVLSYPTSPVAPQALLRLGQALHTAGDHRRALSYLERLRSDYPGTPERDTGLLWLARTQLELGSRDDACSTTRAALGGASSANVRMLLELEQERACGNGVVIARQDVDGVGTVAEDPLPPGATPPAATPPTATPPAATGAAATDTASSRMRVDTLPSRISRVVTDSTRAAPPARSTPPAASQQNTAQQAAGTVRRLQGEYGVQTGAFRELRFAENIARQMRDKGFDVRIVQVQGSDLHRVRVGAFATSAEAAVLGQRVRDAGFASMIVSDVRHEM